LNERFEPGNGTGSGAITAKRNWRLYGEKKLAPLRRKNTGAITPEIQWLLYAENELAPLRRKLTRFSASPSEPPQARGKEARASLSTTEDRIFQKSLQAG
jgi:hypothetical protein